MKKDGLLHFKIHVHYIINKKKKKDEIFGVKMGI